MPQDPRKTIDLPDLPKSLDLPELPKKSAEPSLRDLYTAFMNAPRMGLTRTVGDFITGAVEPVVEGVKTVKGGIQQIASGFTRLPKETDFNEPSKTTQMLRGGVDVALGGADVAFGVIPAMATVSGVQAVLTPHAEKLGESIGGEEGKTVAQKVLQYGTLLPFGKRMLLAALASELGVVGVEKGLQQDWAKDIPEEDKLRIVKASGHAGFFGTIAGFKAFDARGKSLKLSKEVRQEFEDITGKKAPKTLTETEATSAIEAKTRTQPLPRVSGEPPVILQAGEPYQRGLLDPRVLDVATRGLPESPILSARGEPQPVSGSRAAQGILTPTERARTPFEGKIEPADLKVRLSAKEAEAEITGTAEKIPDLKDSNAAIEYGRKNPDAKAAIERAIVETAEKVTIFEEKRRNLAPKTKERREVAQKVVEEGSRLSRLKEALEATQKPELQTPLEKQQAEATKTVSTEPASVEIGKAQVKAIEAEQTQVVDRPIKKLPGDLSVYAAIRMPDGTVYKGGMHGELESRMTEVHRAKLNEATSGFTIGEHFITLDEARAGGGLMEVYKARERGSSVGAFISPELIDRALRPVTQKIAQQLQKAIGRLPEPILRRLRIPFSSTPEIYRAYQQFQTELHNARSAVGEMEKMVLNKDATTGDYIALDRLLRGHPADFNRLPDPLKDYWTPYYNRYHEAAQRLTAEMHSLGLPIRAEWESGAKHWYQNLFPKGLARMALGRLYFMGGRAIGVKAAELSHLKARVSDRFSVVDGEGDFIKNPDTGRLALFESRAEAEAFVRQHSGYRLEYVDNATGRKVIENFPTLAERTKRLDDMSSFGPDSQARNVFAPEGKHMVILEPMTLEQMIGHGLLEDPLINMKRGLSEASGLVAKTRFFENLGRNAVSEVPQDGFVKMSDYYDVPAKLAEKNPWVKRLRDGYVPKALAHDMSTLYGKKGVVRQIYDMANRGMKKALTVFNPFRYVKQPVENELTLWWMDSAAWANKKMQAETFVEYYDAVTGGRRSRMYEDFLKEGISKEDFTRAELMSHAELIQKIRGYDGISNLSMAERLAIWMESNDGSRWVKDKADLLKAIYHHEDIIYKFYAYKWLRNKQGMSSEQAAKRVGDSFFYGKDAPRIIETMSRHIPFAPRVMYEFTRIGLNRLRDYPASTVMKAGLMAYAWNALRDEAHESVGLTKKDIEKMGDAAPAWYDIILPITDEHGKNIKWSLRWLFPFAELGSWTLGGVDDIGRLAVQASPLPLKGVVSTAVGKTAFGQNIAEEGDPDATSKYIGNFISHYTPQMFGQYWYNQYKNMTEKNPEKKLPWWEVALVRPTLGGIQHVSKTQLISRGQVPIFERLGFLEQQKRRILSDVNLAKDKEERDKHNAQLKEIIDVMKTEQKLPVTKEFIKRYAIMGDDLKNVPRKDTMKDALPPLERMLAAPKLQKRK